MTAFWTGFWDNWFWVFVGVGILGSGALAGVREIAAVWAKGRQASRERALERELDEAWKILRAISEAQREWQKWSVGINGQLTALNVQGLPPAPGPIFTLDNWPTAAEIRQQEDDDRRQRVAVELARRQDRRARKRATGGGG